jgi:hypothetical protein
VTAPPKRKRHFWDRTKKIRELPEKEFWDENNKRIK